MTDISAVESADDVEKHIEHVLSHGSDVFVSKHRTKDGEIHDVLVKVKTISIREKTFCLSTWQTITPADA